MTPVKLLLLVAILVHVGSGLPLERKSVGAGAGAGGGEKAQYASWDDVNVLAHGLLQLGHGLKDHVDKTKGQMRDIIAKLKSFNGTVAELGKLTRHLQEEGDALREKAKQLGQREDQVLNASAELQTLAEDMRTERESVRDRVGSLERKVDMLLRGAGSSDDSNHSTSDANTLQGMLETQSKRIDDLVERIRQQQDKLDKQNLRLHVLQTEIKQRKFKSILTQTSEDFFMDAMPEWAGPSNELPSDCHELFLRGKKHSGVYTIKPQDSKPFEVFCEITSDHGWTVIQKREDGSLDFNKLWSDYQNGFGSLSGEFWLGLEKMFSISKQRPYVLQIEFSDWRDYTKSVSYTFQLDGEENNYALHVQPTTPGSLENALTTGPDGLPFSTADKDHDLKEDGNCAMQLSGGWWFSNCGHSNLNGQYQNVPVRVQRHSRKQVVFWKTWHGRYYPLRTTTMKIAPAVKS